VQAAAAPTATPPLGTVSSAAFALSFAAAVSPGNADGGYLSNMLGRNPATQGRNHHNCMGDVPNIGYGVAGGFMPKVKSFFLMPWNGRVNIADGKTPVPTVTAIDGRVLPEDRNALFLSLVSAVRDADAPAPPAAQPPGAQGGTPGSSDPGSAGTPGTAGSDTPGTQGHFVGGCSVGDGNGSAGALGLMLVLAMVALATRRRWS
jgi:MYXO-CTERM domain-containing protein